MILFYIDSARCRSSIGVDVNSTITTKEDLVRIEMLDRYLLALVHSLNGVRCAVPKDALLHMFRAREYTDIIGHVKNHMKIPVALHVGYVNAGGPSAPMWVQKPENMPLFGSPVLQNIRCTIFIRKDFLVRVPFEGLVQGIAHEMSHILLDILRHPLRREEEAVDLCAMACGYSEFFVAGHKTDHGPVVETLGYLSTEEITYAAGYIAAARSLRKR